MFDALLKLVTPYRAQHSREPGVVVGATGGCSVTKELLKCYMSRSSGSKSSSKWQHRFQVSGVAAGMALRSEQSTVSLSTPPWLKGCIGYTACCTDRSLPCDCSDRLELAAFTSLQVLLHVSPILVILKIFTWNEASFMSWEHSPTPWCK